MPNCANCTALPQARAARLRQLYLTGQELAEADPQTLHAVLQRCADRLAFFVGRRSAVIEISAANGGIAIRAPGNDGEVFATLAIEGLASLSAIPDAEDRDAVRMQIDMIGATIDRIRRDREKAALLSALQERKKRLEILLERIFTVQE